MTQFETVKHDFEFSISKDWLKNFDYLKNRKISKDSIPKANGRKHYLDRNIATLEFPTIDIELEAWRANGDEIEDMNSKSTNLTFSYFICIKGHPRDELLSVINAEDDGLVWESDNYANNYPVTINFNDKNWKKKLKEEMLQAIVGYAKDNNYSLFEANFDARK